MRVHGEEGSCAASALQRRGRDARARAWLPVDCDRWIGSLPGGTSGGDSLKHIGKLPCHHGPVELRRELHRGLLDSSSYLRVAKEQKNGVGERGRIVSQQQIASV